MKLSNQAFLKLKKKNFKQSKRKTFIRGSIERPRLSVYRSKNHIYAQLIDDQNSKTLITVSSLERLIKLKILSSKKLKISFAVGQILAKLSIEKNFTKVVFDRGPYLYHGCVKALADGAREGGLLF